MKRVSRYGAPLAGFCWIVAIALYGAATAHAQSASPGTSTRLGQAKPGTNRSWPQELAPWPVHGPPELPYRDGMAPPPGYRLERSYPKPWTAVGLSTLGTAYGFAVGYSLLMVAIGSAVGSSTDQSRQIMVPIAGPFLGLSIHGMQPSQRRLMWIDGLAQVGGGVMTVAALLSVQHKWVRMERGAVTLHIGPIPLGSRAPGIGIAGTF